MFQAILLIIFIGLVIGGIVSVIQYFRSETQTPTPPTAVKKSEFTTVVKAPSANTTTSPVNPQITDSVTSKIGGASNSDTKIKPRNKKKKYYYKPKAAKGSNPPARLKGTISERNRIKKLKLG